MYSDGTPEGVGRMLANATNAGNANPKFDGGAALAAALS
jgi:hypothetical protein